MVLRTQRLILWLISIAAAFMFAWPLTFPSLGLSQQDSAGWLAVATVPVLLVLSLFFTQGRIAGPRQLALLAILASLGAATRIATSGVGGFEFIFVIVILGAAAVSPSFGFLLGASSVLVSSLFFGGFGPWTAFQVFALGWVGLGAGFLHKATCAKRIWPLAIYALIASYIFGLIMNLWFWPFAVGPSTSLSYDSAAGFGQNLVSFLSYSLVSSTLTWDSLRAISTAIGVWLLGKPVLATLARYKF